jgi:hypothetical protein
MNVRERAARDAKKILENTNGAGTPFILVSKERVEFPVAGSFGDIGYLLNPATGEAIQGRTIQAAYSMESLRAQTPMEPERGWRFKVTGLSGALTELFVTMYEPDRTIGIGRITLAVVLDESEN